MTARFDDQLQTHVRNMPDRIAVHVDGRTLTWQELDQSVHRIATHFLTAAPPGSRISLDCKHPLAITVGFLACIRSGHCPVIFDPAWPEKTALTVTTALQPSLTLSDATILKAENDYAKNADVGPGLPIDAPLFIGFTSGSTGTPKGYQRSQLSWIRSTEHTQSVFQLTPDDVVCLPGQLSFSHFLYGLFHSLYVGASVQLFQHFSPSSIAADMMEHRASVLFAVPTQAKVLIDAAAKKNRVFNALRLILTSGAKWRHALSDAAGATIPNAEIIEFYGASELSFISCSTRQSQLSNGAVGSPFAGVEVEIRDNKGVRLPPGQEGRIWVKSPMTFDRYVMGDSPECQRDGDFCTVGDHGKLHQDGTLYLLGREKRMLISAGENLYPEVVEDTLCRCSGIAAAVVFGLEDELRGSKIVAVVKMEPDAKTLAARDLRLHCKENLGARLVPSAFYTLSTWPELSAGKIDINKMAAMIENGHASKLG